MIIDMMAGNMVISDKPNVSEAIIFEFVAEYRSGRSKVVPIPSIPSKEVSFTLHVYEKQGNKRVEPLVEFRANCLNK
jgi:hypothetical protein